MWLAGEVFPRAWKLLGVAWPASRLSARRVVVFIRHRLGVRWSVVAVQLCYAWWMHRPPRHI